MAKKISDQVWKKAEALRKAGKSYGSIAKELNIPMTTLHDRSKKNEWDSNKTEGLIADAVRVESQIRMLEPEQSEVVRKEVEKILEARDFYATNARKVAKAALSGLAKDVSPMNAKTTMEVLHKGLVVEGVVPYYPNATTINNTNAQQNNAPRVLDDFYGEP